MVRSKGKRCPVWKCLPDCSYSRIRVRAPWIPNLMTCGYGDSTAAPAMPLSYLPALGVGLRNVSSSLAGSRRKVLQISQNQGVYAFCKILSNRGSCPEYGDC